MKKLNYVILYALVAFDYLLYKQQPGINILIFNTLLIGMCLKEKPELRFNKYYVFSACAVMISSLSVACYGDKLSCFTTILSMAFMSSTYANKANSAITAFFSSGCTYMKSPITIIKNSLEKETYSENKKKSTFKIKLTLTLISIAITLLFVIIYQNSNLIFYQFTQKIDLSFINWSFFFFTLNGFLLIFSFFSYSQIKWLNNVIDKPSKNISSISLEGNGSFTPEMERFMGSVLLSLLNGLLLIVNILDINYLINRKLPEGIAYSQYVHQGVGILILSILLAVFILMYLFRGNLNFLKNNSFLKTLAYAWALQNIFMITSTIFRNNMYIEAYGLTEKRIGVYFYLFLSIIGLTTSIIKIYKKHSNSFLVRVNSIIFFAILVLSCTLSWDYLISKYNLSRKDAVRNLPYLNELSSSNIPLLQSYLEKRNYLEPQIRIKLEKRIYQFLSNEKQFTSWKSWNYCHQATLDQIKKFKLKRIDLQYISLENIGALAKLPQIEELHIKGCYDWNIKEWSYLTGIKRLFLDSNNLQSISFIGKLKNLEYLEITGTLSNNSLIYSPLYSLKNLKIISINKTDQKTIEQLKMMLPRTKILTVE